MKKLFSPRIGKFGLRADIQVLRGISVLAVVFYHLGLPITGGFLGVDSFFVISGFVITGTLLRSNGTIRSRIFEFYKKRVRRILPLSIYITLTTLLASFLFLPRIYLNKYLLDAVSSIFMMSNIKFAKDGVNYLQQTLYSSPFLHFWSLGIEEQFYLFWPLLLLTLFRWRTLYYVALPTLFIASIITPHFYPTASFFSPTSRSWEFLVGAFVATLRPGRLNKIVNSITLLLFSFLVLCCLIYAKPNSNLIQFFTLILVMGTGVIIYVGFSSTFFKPLEEIGNISYSLYLIHWPIIAIILVYSERISKFQAIGIFLCSLLLAKFLTANFENPIRFGNNFFRSSKFWVSVFLPILTLCVLAWSRGFSINQSSQLFEINNARPIIYDHGCEANAKAVKPKTQGCDFGDLHSNNLIMLVGDSHASQWFSGFEKTSATRGFKLRVATKSSCPAILLKSDAKVINPNCIIWEKNLLQYINTSKPRIVIISNLTEGSAATNTAMKLAANLYVRSQIDFISEINPEIKVAVIGDTPYPGKDSVTCLSFNWRNPRKCDLKNTKSAKTQMTKTVSNYRTTYFDSRLYLCKDEICPAILNNINVYRDGSHLSVSTIDIQEILARQVLDLIS